MNRKKSFILILFCLMAGLSFWLTSCSSGFEEKGSVTFSFSDKLINSVMARAGDTAADADAPKMEGVIMSFIGTDDRESDTYTLMLKDDYTYFICSANMLNELSEKLKTEIEGKFAGYENLTPEQLANGNFDLTAYQEYLKFREEYKDLQNNPYALYEDATISAGSWEKTGSTIKLTEKSYYDGTSLVEVSSPAVIASITDKNDLDTFKIKDSKYGKSMSFYNYNYGDFNNPDIKPEHEEDDYESEKDKKLTNPKIKITVAAGKTYEKEIDITYDLLDGSPVFHKAETRFDNLPLGRNATVTVEFIWNDTTFVKGIRDFVIEEETEVNVTLKFVYEKIPKEFYMPENDPENDKPVYSAMCLLPEDYREYFNGGWLYFTAYKDKTYDIIANHYNADGSPAENRTFAKGSWYYDENDDNADDVIRLKEEWYYDLETGQLVAVDEYDYNTVIYLSASGFLYNGTAIQELQFKNSEMSPLDYEYDLDFSITGLKDVSSDISDLIEIYYVTNKSTITNTIKEKVTPEDVSTLLLKDDVYQLQFSDQFTKDDNGLKLSTSIRFPEKLEKPLYFFAIVHEETADYKDIYSYIGLANEITLKDSANSVEITMYPVIQVEEPEQEELNTSADGSITKKDGALVINYSAGKLYRNNGKIAISARKADGSNLSAAEEDSLQFIVKLYYGGNLVNPSENSYSYDENSKQIIINNDQPLAKGGNYQLFVESAYNTDFNEKIINSQTFNIPVDDYLYYELSLNSGDENYLDGQNPESELYNKLVTLYNEHLYLKFSGNTEPAFMQGIIGEEGIIKDFTNVSAIFDFEDVEDITNSNVLNSDNPVQFDQYSISKIEKIILPASLKKIMPGAFTGNFERVNSNIVLAFGKNVELIVSPWQKSYSPFKSFELSSENTNYVISEDGKLILSNDEKTLVLAANNFTDSFTVPDSVTTIGDNAFCGASTLKNINFNNVTKVGKYAFNNCGVRGEYDNPLNLGKIEIIDSYAFNSDYIYVVFPETLKAIGAHALKTNYISFSYNETYEWEYVYGENAETTWQGWINAGNCDELPESNCGVMQQSSFTESEYTEGSSYMKYAKSSSDYYFYRK